MLPTVVPVRPALFAGPDADVVPLNFRDLSQGQVRQGPDGWHAIFQLQGVEHRVWLKEPALDSPAYTIEFLFDRDVDFRAHACTRLWRAANGRPPGDPLRALSRLRRRRVVLALRAQDARIKGATYREIAEVLFGLNRISEREWSTHELRGQMRRLVQYGRSLIRGGYRKLLRPASRKKKK
ncbi:DUF2285 domain-containing protein [Bradyrhizobium hipponense]|uniref:DUF2285 domain-containing protein n=1 Tax=Bradyrhizobium hipponense TaxID=2605638 RepID=A0A5S4YAF7_9BRAD|nr:DUF2285 domain-containing protein [Bradyrhizobium hipponense]TYO61396.1 DUF2285 domain-containing protein [Bradyrhizobium hipponense]